MKMLLTPYLSVSGAGHELVQGWCQFWPCKKIGCHPSHYDGIMFT